MWAILTAQTAEETDHAIAMENATIAAAARTAQRQADREASAQTAARLTEIADQINAGHIPPGVRACGPGGRVIVGPAEISELEAGA